MLYQNRNGPHYHWNLECVRSRKRLKWKLPKSRPKKEWCQKQRTDTLRNHLKLYVKMASRVSKKSMILEKLEAENNYSGDDFQGEKIFSTQLKRQVDSVVSAHEIIAISSKITHESGKTFDAQDIFLDDKMY